MHSVSSKLYQRNLNYCKIPDFMSRNDFAVELRKNKRRLISISKRKKISKTQEIDFEFVINCFNDLDDLLNSKSDQLSIYKHLKFILDNIENLSIIPYNILSDSKFVFNLLRIIESKSDDSTTELVTYILCSITAGPAKTIDLLMNLGTLTLLLQLLYSPNDDIKENVIWSIGNIAGCSDTYAQTILNSDFPSHLSLITSVSQNSNLMKTSLHTIGNLIRENCTISSYILSILLNILSSSLIFSSSELICEYLRVLRKLSNKSEHCIQLIIDLSHARKVLELTSCYCEDIISLSFAVIENLMAGNYFQTQTLVNMGVVEKFKKYINSDNPVIRKQVLWGLRNLTNGTTSQIADLVEAPIARLMLQKLVDCDASVRIEASLIIRNIAINGCTQSLVKIVGLDVFSLLKYALEDVCRDVVVNSVVASVAIFNRLKDKKLLANLAGSGFVEAFEKMYYRSKNGFHEELEDLFLEFDQCGLEYFI